MKVWNDEGKDVLFRVNYRADAKLLWSVRLKATGRVAIYLSPAEADALAGALTDVAWRARKAEGLA